MKTEWPKVTITQNADGSVTKVIDSGLFVQTTTTKTGSLSHKYMDPGKEVFRVNLEQFTYPEDIESILNGILSNCALEALPEKCEELIELVDELKGLIQRGQTLQACSCAFRVGALYTELRFSELEPFIQKERNRSTKEYRGGGARAVKWLIQKQPELARSEPKDVWCAYERQVMAFKGKANPPFPVSVSRDALVRAFNRYWKQKSS